MRIEDGIINQLAKEEYQWLDIKISNMDMFYRAHTMGTDIVLILRAISGSEITVNEYKMIINNIKNYFIQRAYPEVHLLGIILTASPERAKPYCLDDEDHCIVDITNRRLIIYENQSSYFLDIISMVEEIVYDESYIADISQKRYTENYNNHSHKMQWVTLLNTLIIAVNIIIYLIIHHTGIFGETDHTLGKGALSWYLIKEKGQYYRILTSMFLHSDFEHLINNMLVLFFVGDNLERAVGKIRYLLIYFSSGIIAAISSIGYNMLKRKMVFSIGASGAIFGIVGAMMYILLVNKGRMEDISSRQIILFAIFSLYGGIANANIDNIAHIGGFVAGIILALLLYRRPKKSDKVEVSKMYQGGQEES